MKSIVRSIVSLAFVGSMSLALLACGGNAIGVSGTGDDNTGGFCAAGELVVGGCANTCGAGLIAARKCFNDESGFSSCGCFNGGTNNTPDAGTGTPAPVCTTGMVQYGTTCRTDCQQGWTTSTTCVLGQWADCRCVAPSPGGGGCVANSITENNCGGAVCPSGQYAGQQCNAAGNGYGVCTCFVRTGGGTTTCTSGYQRNCNNAISCGTGQVPREVCNSAGNGWNACQCVSSGISQICTPYASTGGSCICSGGNGGTQYCNANGDGYTCSCMTGTACTPGQLYTTSSCTGRLSCGSGQTAQQLCNSAGAYGDCQCAAGTGSTEGAQTMRIAIDTEFWRYDRNTDGTILNDSSGRSVVFCDPNNLNVRCFIAAGEQVFSPRTTDRTISLRAFKAGYVNCDVACGSAIDAPVHPLLWRGNWNSLITSTGRGLTVLSVTGGPSTSSMANQIGTARFCQSGGGTKIRAAIDNDQLGICAS